MEWYVMFGGKIAKTAATTTMTHKLSGTIAISPCSERDGMNSHFPWAYDNTRECTIEKWFDNITTTVSEVFFPFFQPFSIHEWRIKKKKQSTKCIKNWEKNCEKYFPLWEYSSLNAHIEEKLKDFASVRTTFSSSVHTKRLFIRSSLCVIFKWWEISYYSNKFWSQT